MDIPKIFLLAVSALFLSLVFIFFIYFITMTILKFIAETFGSNLTKKGLKKDDIISSNPACGYDVTDIVFHAPPEE